MHDFVALHKQCVQDNPKSVTFVLFFTCFSEGPLPVALKDILVTKIIAPKNVCSRTYLFSPEEGRATFFRPETYVYQLHIYYFIFEMQGDSFR